MSDETAAPDETPAAPDPIDPSSDAVDLMLKTLVISAQSDDDFEFGVTLTVRGATVTGTLVGRNAWLRQVHDTLGGGERGLAAQWVERFSYDPDNEPDRLRDDQFIHLADARTVFGDGVVPGHGAQGGLWRGLLASVDGWQIGTLKP